jgi:uncharacterized protein
VTVPVAVAAPTRRPSAGTVTTLGDPDAIVIDDEHGGRHLFVVDGSRLYELDPLTAERMATAVSERRAVDELARLGLGGQPFVDDRPITAPPLRTISLAVAQKCNLGCTYCYAQQGDFGMQPRSMSFEEAAAAVDLLLDDAPSGDRVTVAFMGGEPLVNRTVVRAATEYAVRRGSERGVHVAFSITTNGTLLDNSDVDFFERQGFAVTISIDGNREQHDALRPFRNGRGSYDHVLARVRPLLDRQRAMQVSARVTVTPSNLEIIEIVDELLTLGFHSVGVSPMLSSPTGTGEVGPDDLAVLLDRMIAAGRRYEQETLAGRRYAFANVANAMREIDRGTHRPYPCGAGAGYLGVAAGGELATCHRFVGDDAGRIGSLATGIDGERREAWLGERHVHRQEPCRSCWARYLCGGGCHHEVIHRGRPACDYIRGWLEYCVGAYVRLTSAGVSFVGEGLS